MVKGIKKPIHKEEVVQKVITKANPNPPIN